MTPNVFRMRAARDKAVFIAILTVTLIGTVNGVYLSWLSKTNLAAFWVADSIQWLVVPGWLIYWLKSRYDFRLAEIKMGTTDMTLSAVLLAVAVALTLYPAFFWVKKLSLMLFGHVGSRFSLAVALPTGGMGKILWLYSAITAGIIESIFFLGLPWLLWSRHKPGGTAIFTVTVSVVFAAIHWEQGLATVLGALMFSVVTCGWYLRANNLWPIVIGHVVIDLIAFS